MLRGAAQVSKTSALILRGKQISQESLFLSLVIVFFLLVALTRAIYLVQKTPDIGKSRAQEINALYVRISKANLSPGESFILYVDSSHLPNTPYNGNLEYMVQTCDAEGLNCRVLGGIWKDASGAPINVVNGKASVNVALDEPAATNALRIKPWPNPNNLNWSNLFSYNVSQHRLS